MAGRGALLLLRARGLHRRISCVCSTRLWLQTESYAGRRARFARVDKRCDGAGSGANNRRRAEDRGPVHLV